MKRLIGGLMAAVCIAIAAYGIYYQMLWENSLPQAKQEWLITFFEKKGFKAVWEMNNNIHMSDFGLVVPLVQTEDLYAHNYNKLRESNFIKFYERSTNAIFFVFGTRVYAVQKKHDQETKVRNDSITVPKVSDSWFTPKGGGELSLASQDELEQHFPYPEVRRLRTRPLLLFWTLISLSIAIAALVTYKRISPNIWLYTHKKTRRRTPNVVFPGVKQTRQMLDIVKSNVQSTGPPPEIVKQELFARLRDEIQTKDPERKHKDELDKLYREVLNMRRLAMIRYALNKKLPDILDGNNKERQVNTRPVQKNDLPKKRHIIQELNALNELSEIKAYAPKPFAPCIEKILIELLQPFGKAPFIGEHRILRVNLQRNVCNRSLLPETFKKAFDWLVRQGVILQISKHGANDSCSMNHRVQETKTEAGKTIISIAIRVRQQMDRQR